MPDTAVVVIVVVEEAERNEGCGGVDLKGRVKWLLDLNHRALVNYGKWAWGRAAHIQGCSRSRQNRPALLHIVLYA